MSILSPLTAVISAVIPVGVGLLEGERLGTPAVAGLLIAVLAIVLVGGGPSAESSRPGRPALVLAIGAGAAIAAQLICLHQAPAGSGLAPLLAGSIVSSSVLLGAVVTLRRRIGTTPPRWALAVGSGALSALANLAFLLAVRSGDLSIVAVITALYPARPWCWRGSCWANASTVSRSRVSRYLDWPCASRSRVGPVTCRRRCHATNEAARLFVCPGAPRGRCTRWDIGMQPGPRDALSDNSAQAPARSRSNSMNTAIGFRASGKSPGALAVRNPAAR